MLIRSDNIGPRYSKITLGLPGIKDANFEPGQCMSLGGRVYAVAAARQGEVELVVRSDLLYREFFDAEKNSKFPVGPGFDGWQAPHVYLIAAGTGLGAFIRLVEERKKLDLDTTLHFYGRHVTQKDLLAAFPQLSSVELGCWDTATWSRPRARQEVLILPPHYRIFFAGPKSFCDDLKAVEDGPRIHLNIGEKT